VRLRYAPEVITAYETLDKAGSAALLDAVDDALAVLEADPGGTAARKRSGLEITQRPGDFSLRLVGLCCL
jgi:hypothetical protein